MERWVNKKVIRLLVVHLKIQLKVLE